MSKSSDEEQATLAKLQSEAKPANPDTELRLRDLSAMAAARRKDPDLEKRYEDLRSELADQLAKEGPRYFIDNDGMKHYAFAVVPEPIEIDVFKLMDFDESGALQAGVLDKVAPRKADKDAFRRAVSNGSITREQFLAVAQLTAGTKFVKFSSPIDEQ